MINVREAAAGRMLCHTKGARVSWWGPLNQKVRVPVVSAVSITMYKIAEGGIKGND